MDEVKQPDGLFVRMPSLSFSFFLFFLLLFLFHRFLAFVVHFLLLIRRLCFCVHPINFVTNRFAPGLINDPHLLCMGVAIRVTFPI